MKTQRLAVVLLAGAMAIAGCGSGGDSSPSATATPPASSMSATPTPAMQTTAKSTASLPPLKFELRSEMCDSKEGEIITAKGSGFTPNDTYTTTATDPEGFPVPGILNPGPISSKGTTPEWKWPCQGDAPGKYSITVHDDATDREIMVTLKVV